MSNQKQPEPAAVAGEPEPKCPECTNAEINIDFRFPALKVGKCHTCGHEDYPAAFFPAPSTQPRPIEQVSGHSSAELVKEWFTKNRPQLAKILELPTRFTDELYESIADLLRSYAQAPSTTEDVRPFKHNHSAGSDYCPECTRTPDVETLARVDESNLRFYARMAEEFKWATDIIHHSVIATTLKEIADRTAILSRRSAEPQVVEMRLCESERLFLKPDQLYRFTVADNCQRCKEIAEATLPEQGWNDRLDDKVVVPDEAGKQSYPGQGATEPHPHLCLNCGKPWIEHYADAMSGDGAGESFHADGSSTYPKCTRPKVALPAQGEPPQLYVISVTGDGGSTSIVEEKQLKQAVHDEYCSCGLEWTNCTDEVVKGTLANLDDEEQWTRHYPDYKRHSWTDHGEDYTVEVLSVTKNHGGLAASPQQGQGWVFVSSGQLPKPREWVNVCTEHNGRRHVSPAFGVNVTSNLWRWECEFTVIAWQPPSRASRSSGINGPIVHYFLDR